MTDATVDLTGVCCCGVDHDPSKYDTDQLAFVAKQVEELGPYIPLVPVRAHRGADRYQRGWMVPRWYIALHGIKASDVPLLAVRYSWEEA